MSVEANEIHRYPCASCGADLLFEPRDGFLTCPYCGHKEAIAESKERVEEQSFEQHLQRVLQHQLGGDRAQGHQLDGPRGDLVGQRGAERTLLLVEVRVPGEVEGAVYRKFRSRSSEDRPCVAVAVAQVGGKLRVVVGAVAERSDPVAACLSGRKERIANPLVNNTRRFESDRGVCV